MVEGFAKGFQPGDAADDGETTEQTPKAKTSTRKSVKPTTKRPKTALPRELAYKKALLRKMGQTEDPIGVSTVKAKTKESLNQMLSSSAPRRKQEVLIPKQKRVKRRLRPIDPEESKEIGTKILP